MPKPLSVRRAADREHMAHAAAAALETSGAAVERDHCGPREIILHVACHGASCYVDFDGDTTQPDTWIVTWNTDKRMSPSMGDVNPHHGRKATRVFHSLDALIEGLCDDVARFADGSAYTQEPVCAMCGRPWAPWPLRRPALCAPKDWVRCIHPTQGVRPEPLSEDVAS